MNGLIRYILLGALTMAFVGAKGNDSLKVNSFNSFKINDFQNYWSSIGNAAGMTYNMPRNISDFNTGVVNGVGDYHRVMEGSDWTDFLLTTKSYRIINKIFLSGSFSYHNQQETGARWNGTYEPYRGNPYILGDSVTGASYRKESYDLSGGIAMNINPRLSFGCKVEYFVGIGAKQKDPRPENNVVRLLINPGIILHSDQFNFGIDAGYTKRKEEVDYIQYITENPDIAYFAFKGFGFYDKEIDMSYYRFQNEHNLFGGLQLETLKKAFPSLTEFRFKYGHETIDDGSSAISKEKGGDWDHIDLKFKEIVHFGKGNQTHRFMLNAGYFDGYGSEYFQDKIYHGNIVEYVTISSHLKLDRKILQGELDYSWMRLNNNRQLDWLLNGRVGAINNQETFYYIPELFSSSYTNCWGLVSLEKDFYHKSFHAAPSLSVSYSGNLSSEMDLSDLTEITKRQMKDIYIRDFQFQSTNLLKLEAQVVCGFTFKKSKLMNQLFFNFGFSYFKPSEWFNDATVLTAKIGFMF
jgi:hypothetical protein